MIPFYLLLLLPCLGAMVLALMPSSKISGRINSLFSTFNFLVALILSYFFLKNGPLLALGHYFYLDAFNLLLVILTTFITMTTSFFSNTYMWHNVLIKRISLKRLKIYHLMYQLFALMTLIALTTNNLGILWIAMEGATLATVLLVSLYRNKEGIEAAWKYFILCIVGIALALFGTILIYFSAVEALPQTDTRMFLDILIKNAAHLNPAIIKFAFIFVLVGYGTKIGFVPLHNWLPDAYTESPAPVTVLLSGILSNVSLYALLRFKILVDHALNNHLTDNLFIGFGLISFIVGAIFLQRQYKMKRLFSYSSIEHLGLIAIAFGIGGQEAIYIGLLYILVHAIAKSGTFMIVGSLIQHAGTQVLDKIRGLIKSQPKLGWGIIISTLVIAAIPPFGIFTCELILFTLLVNFAPVLAVILVIGLILGLSGLLRNIQPVVYGEPSILKGAPFCIFPAFIHLGLVLIMGVYLPPALNELLHEASAIFLK